MSSFWHLQHNPCCIVLDALQLVDGSHRSSVKHRVAVVDHGHDETVGQRLCELGCEQMPCVMDGMCEVVAYTCYHCNMFVKCEPDRWIDKQQTRLKALVQDYPGEPVPKRYKQSGFY